MAREIKKRGKRYFQCKICRLYYHDNKLAKKCEDFCRKNNSCNLEIIKHAIN